MKPTVKSTTIYGLLKQALAPTESILCAEYHRQLHAQLNELLKELAEDGWDAHKRFAFPHGNQSRTDYQIQRSRYELMIHYTEQDGDPYACRGMHDPDIRKEKPGNRLRIFIKADEMAVAALEGFCWKLTGKIDDEMVASTGRNGIQSISYIGGTDPWGWSFIRVHFVNKTCQNWRTRMIINCSCLGKLFNQWPTRLMK